MNKRPRMTQSIVFYSLAFLGLIGIFFVQVKTLFYIAIFIGLVFLVYYFILKKDPKPVKIRPKKKRIARRKSPSLYVINGGKKTSEHKRKARLVTHRKKPS